MDEIQTPNLDCMTAEELRQCETVLARLASYAGHKRNAMRLRIEGQISAALREEKAADDQYQQLPANCTW